MNQDELGSLARKILIVALTALATRLHMSDVTWVLPVATDLADLGVVMWGIYAHRGMVKVPEAQQFVAGMGTFNNQGERK